MAFRMASLWQDLRYASRSLRKNPGFCAVAVATLALGIGANSAIFSLVYAALLRPLPFTQAHRLAFVSTGLTRDGVFRSGASGRELEEWKPQLRQVFDDFATLSGNRDTTWTAAGQDSHLRAREVSDNFFTLLGVSPLAGRTFAPEDSAQGHGDVAVLSYDFWQQQFGGDLGALGQSMRQKGGAYPAYTVIGILPKRFEFDEPTDVWMPQQPLSAFVMNLRTARRFRVVGRLQPQIGFAQAQSAMNTLATQEAQSFPASNRGWGISLVPLKKHFQADGRLVLLLLWAAVGCLLLIACVNTANLLLARSGAREREIAVRLALGSSRGRLMAQLLTESGLLALLGGGLGWMVALCASRLLLVWGSYLLPASTMQDIVRLHADSLDPAVLAFTLLISLVSVLTFGLAPARRSTRLALNASLQASSGNRATRSHRTLQMLVAIEAALVVVLAMSAGLLVRSMAKLTAIDPGFRTANRLTFDIELPRALQSAAASPRMTPEENRQQWHRRTAWFEDLERRLQSIPGVQAAGASNSFPFTDAGGGWESKVEGVQLPPSTSIVDVSPGYFDTVGAPLVAGVNFGPATYAIPGSKPLIVNQTMARLLFPDGSALGKHVNAPRCQAVNDAVVLPTDCVIIGIAKDTRFSLDTPAPPTFYHALHQDGGDRQTYVARVSGDPAALIPQVRAIVSAMPEFDYGKAYLFRLETMDQLAAQSVAAPRFRSWLASLFAGLALLLAAVGIYGVQAYAVTRRTQEIGIRMALGARPASVFQMILGEAAGWTLLGAGLGIAAGLAVNRLIAGLLFGVTPWDPVTLVASPLLLLAVSMAAAFTPARRAMRVDPISALRCE
jgi:putative ABC transport system permease protein